MRKSNAHIGLWGPSVRGFFGAAPARTTSESGRVTKPPMTKSELQRLFARELGYAREFSTKMQHSALRQAAR